MRKLNNKGMTLIELLVCFIIVSAIVVSMFNVIMNYTTDEQTEVVRNDITNYKNVITRIIQKDIINNGLSSVSLDSFGKNGNNDCYTFTLNFNKAFIENPLSKSKKLTVCTNTTVADGNYIIYQEVNTGKTLQDSKYPLLDSLSSSSNSSTPLYFSSVDTNLIKKSDSTDMNSEGLAVFMLDIGINHSEIGSDYHIKIIAPLNYFY